MTRGFIFRSTSAGLAAAALLMVGAAGAQISQGDEPLAIASDRFELDQARGLQIWSGRAEATQGQNRLRAGELRVHHAPKGDNPMGDVQRIEAIGDVYFVTPTQTARGDRADYAVNQDTLTMTGDVILRQGESVLTGSRLVVNTATGQARMEGGASETSQTRRVRGVFYPDSRN